MEWVQHIECNKISELKLLQSGFAGYDQVVDKGSSVIKEGTKSDARPFWYLHLDLYLAEKNMDSIRFGFDFYENGNCFNCKFEVDFFRSVWF